MKKYFVILSEGAYSDYSPDYYIGYIEITQEELSEKGKEVGRFLMEQYNLLPERKSTSVYEWDKDKMEKYDVNTDKTIFVPSDRDWQPIMEQWLFEKGYEKLPDNIPEINIYYDLPT